MSLQAMALLLEAGANRDLCTDRGQSPLWLVASASSNGLQSILWIVGPCYGWTRAYVLGPT